jgi:hypothetical protein
MSARAAKFIAPCLLCLAIFTLLALTVAHFRRARHTSLRDGVTQQPEHAAHMGSLNT